MFGFINSPPPPPPFFDHHPPINDEVPCHRPRFSDCDHDFDEDEDKDSDDDKKHRHRKTIGSQHHDQGTRYIKNAKKHPNSGPPYDQGSRYIENVQKHGRGLSQQQDP
jgi:hypothetical protein